MWSKCLFVLTLFSCVFVLLVYETSRDFQMVNSQLELLVEEQDGEKVIESGDIFGDARV